MVKINDEIFLIEANRHELMLITEIMKLVNSPKDEKIVITSADQVNYFLDREDLYDFAQEWIKKFGFKYERHITELKCDK